LSETRHLAKLAKLRMQTFEGMGPHNKYTPRAWMVEEMEETPTTWATDWPMGEKYSYRGGKHVRVEDC
jgi:hypothetical protein